MPVEKALKDANLQLTEINEVILVGGSTRIPAVQELVQKLSGKPPNLTVNPDEVVALGAAVQAGVLAGEAPVWFQAVRLTCPECSARSAPSGLCLP